MERKVLQSVEKCFKGSPPPFSPVPEHNGRVDCGGHSSKGFACNMNPSNLPNDPARPLLYDHFHFVDENSEE